MATPAAVDNSDAINIFQNAILESFGFDSVAYKIKPMEKANNNKVFLIEFAAPIETASMKIEQKPLTHPIPQGTTRFVFRIPKNNVSMEDSVRIRNEVAFLFLAREALAPATSTSPTLCPRVFAWDDTSDSQWIIEEFKEGDHFTPDELGGLSIEQQTLIFDQIAGFIKALQVKSLPEDVCYGGLTFDEEGRIFSTKSPIPCGGPFETYADFLEGMCNWQLEASERSTHINGWKDNTDLRKRLDDFFANGLKKVLATVQEDKPTLVHADLGLNNILFDRSNNTLIGVIDFDFSHIGSAISEYLFSFYDIGGLLPGSGQSMGPIRDFLLNGFPETNEDADDIKMARLFDAALDRTGVKKPSNLGFAGTAADIWWFSQELCQAFWFMDGFISKRSTEKLEELKTGSAEVLDAYLTLWGY